MLNVLVHTQYHTVCNLALAIDAEFTGLAANESQRPSLFDTPCERYQKVKRMVSQFLVCQIGSSFGVCLCYFVYFAVVVNIFKVNFSQVHVRMTYLFL